MTAVDFADYRPSLSILRQFQANSKDRTCTSLVLFFPHVLCLSWEQRDLIELL